MAHRFHQGWCCSYLYQLSRGQGQVSRTPAALLKLEESKGNSNSCCRIICEKQPGQEKLGVFREATVPVLQQPLLGNQYILTSAMSPDVKVALTSDKGGLTDVPCWQRCPGGYIATHEQNSWVAFILHKHRCFLLFFYFTLPYCLKTSCNTEDTPLLLFTSIKSWSLVLTRYLDNQDAVGYMNRKTQWNKDQVQRTE